MRDHERIAANRALWQRWTALHVPSEFYDVEGFVADPAARPFDRIIADLVGDVRGKRVLHLQCHFGMDTLRFGLLGASEVTGFDFSSEAIAAARDLSAKMGIPATFIEGDVLDPPAELPEDAFDLVFTSYGVLSWLPDLGPWAHTIASRLAPGGVFKVADSHPTAWIFDDEAEDPTLRVRYSYFMRDALPWDEHGSYAVPLPEEDTGVSHSWQHTFEEILGALIGAGLVIEEVREFPLLAWKYTPGMVEREPGLFGLPEDQPEVPLLFTLIARKPE